MVGFTAAEGFAAIGYIVGIECILGRARWLKTKHTEFLSRVPSTF